MITIELHKVLLSRWGYCTGMCPHGSYGRRCVTVEGGPVVNALCVFPFRYKGVQYYTCPDVDDTEPWCATDVDTHGNFIQGFWGRCNCDSKFKIIVSSLLSLFINFVCIVI